MRRVTCIALAAAILTGCGSDEGGDCDPIAAALVERIEVSPASPTVNPGETLPLSAVAFSCAGPLGSITFTWESADAAIATVSPSGVVSAIATGGPVQIVARAQGKQGAASVTVGRVQVTSVTVTPSPTTVGVGRTAQLTARAFDADGDEVTGRAATWSSANEAVASVNASGLVTGVVAGGPVAITATVDGVSGSSQVSVSLVPVASVTVSPPNPTIPAGGTVQLAATLRDEQGNVLTGRTVTWSSANDQVAQVSATGLVTGQRAGGPVTITAASEGRTGSAQVTVTVGAATRLAFIQQPTNVVAGAAIAPAIVVEVQDQAGNRITSDNNRLVTLALQNPPTGVALGGTVSATTVNGRATFSNITLARAGSGYTIIAAASGVTGVTSTAFTVTPGAPDRLAFITQPSNVEAGEPITPAVRVEIRDAFENRVNSTASVTLSLVNPPGGTGVLAGTSTVNAVAGIATFGTLTVDRAAAGYALVATSVPLTGATSTTFNVSAGAAERLAFLVRPSDVTAGQVIDPPVVVQALDALGNVDPTFNGAVQLVLQGGPIDAVLSGTTQVNAVGGQATFSTLSINRAASGYTLVASASGLAPATSPAFSVAVGQAAGLGFVVQPSDVQEGDLIQPAPQVEVRDAGGNRVTNYTTAILVALRSDSDGPPPPNTSFQGSSTTSVVPVAGVATFGNLRVSVSNNRNLRLRATSGALSGVSERFRVEED